jgi:hydrogenase nickel incorporation protein HypA/HybF
MRVKFNKRPGLRSSVMHEWALADSIIVAARAEAEREHLQTITEIEILLGELQQIDKEILEFALSELAKEAGPLFVHSVFTFKTEPGMLSCNVCGKEWKYGDLRSQIDEAAAESIHFLPEVALVYTRCPQCKSPDFRITKGRGVLIGAIRGKR